MKLSDNVRLKIYNMGMSMLNTIEGPEDKEYSIEEVGDIMIQLKDLLSDINKEWKSANRSINYNQSK